MELRYSQCGEPGPRPAASYLQGADAAVLHLRALQLTPQGAAAGAAACLPVAAEGAEEGGAGPSSASVVDGPAGAAGERSPVKAAAAAAAAAAGATAGAVPLEQESFWRLLLRLPATLWQGIVTDRPSATRLGVSGVSLRLLTYPTTWPGYHAAVRPAAAPAPVPFAFTPGAAGAGGAAGEARKRRRPRGALAGTAAAAGAAAGAAAAAAGTGGELQQHRAAAAAGAAGHEEQEAAEPFWVDHAVLLRDLPVEEHIVFRQWEFSVVLCLLPAAFVPPPVAPAAAAGAAAAAGDAAAATAAPPAASGSQAQAQGTPPSMPSVRLARASMNGRMQNGAAGSPFEPLSQEPLAGESLLEPLDSGGAAADSRAHLAGLLLFAQGRRRCICVRQRGARSGSAGSLPVSC